jgi:hypothetical protein
MSHNIQVIIAKDPLIDEVSLEWNHACELSLPQGYSIIPMIEKLYDDINELTNNKNPSPYEQFELLSSSIEELLKLKSNNSSIAYIETEYFGGTGIQRAFYQNVIVPEIRLTGKWLRDIGFNEGNYVNVKIQNNKRIVTLDKKKSDNNG